MSFDFSREPLQHFQEFLKEAQEAGLTEPTGMALATVGPNGRPSVRTVLFKGLYQSGLTFYTNYEGRKGRELSQTPVAALNFWWPSLEKQVRFEGRIEKLPRDVSEAYFATRPRLSQIGAWSSQQSEEIPNLEFLKEKTKEVEKRFEGKTIPCPPFWGGFVLIPEEIEFWVGRTGRLHERYIYKKVTQGWHTFLRSP
ncbi:MAG: pyridoxamine 5'-phosphate oxidase [Bdellovibrionales bacterium]